MTRRTNLWLLTMVVIVAAGCATLTGYNFDVEVKNGSAEPMTKVTVRSAKGFWDQPGYLSPGARKSIAGPFRQPYEDLWTVSWKTAKGEQLEKTLDLTKAFPKPFHGRLIFSIDAKNSVSHSTADIFSK